MRTIEEIEARIESLKETIEEYRKGIVETNYEDEIESISHDIYDVQDRIDLLKWVLKK